VLQELAQLCCVSEVPTSELDFECCKLEYDKNEGSMFWEDPDIRMYILTKQE